MKYGSTTYFVYGDLPEFVRGNRIIRVEQAKATASVMIFNT